MRSTFFVSCMILALAARAQQSDDAFNRQAAAQYQSILGQLAARGQLDPDAAALVRVRRVASGLITTAAKTDPSTALWSWEVHITTDPTKGAFCLAGGKMVIGTAMIDGLRLDDAELAMLIGHEMAHALAGHRRAADRAGIGGDPAGESAEAAIAQAQETEADRVGMALAHAAGWPLSHLVSFFDKMAAAQPQGAFSATHPQALERARAARAYAAVLEGQPQ